VATYNEVQVGRYVRFIQKFLGIKGRQPAPLTFAGEIGAMWSLFHGNENRYLESWNLFGSAQSPTGGAGQIAAVRFRNPAKSNIVAVIHKLSVANSTGTDTLRGQYATTGTDLTTVAGAPFRMDARGNPNSSLILSTTTNATFAGSTFFLAIVPINTTYDVIVDQIQELPILPGDAITIFSNVNASNIIVSAFWRERLLEESELT
jgi:hypothetical protein